MRAILAVALFSALALGGCFSPFGGGDCRVSGGTSLWHQPGVYDDMQDAAAADDDSRRTLLQTLAGIEFPHPGLQADWGQWYRLESIQYRPTGSGPTVTLDLTEKPPVARAASLGAGGDGEGGGGGGGDEVRQRAAGLLDALVEPGTDTEGWLDAFMASGESSTSGRSRFYAHPLEIPLRLEARFNETYAAGEVVVVGAPAIHYDDPAGLDWTFSILAQEVTKADHAAVRSNTAHWVFVDIVGAPPSDTAAREQAAATLADYNVTATGFSGFRFEEELVCP